MSDKLQAQHDKLKNAMRRILMRATPHPDDTNGDRKRYLAHIESIASEALKDPS